MKKTLVALFTLFALSIASQASFAACPCKPCDPCAKPCNPCCEPCEKPCNPCCDPCEKPCDPCCDPCAKECCDPCCCDPCCEKWLDCKCLQDYFCRMGFNECQKAQALAAIEKFKCETQCLRAKGCDCENKCDCREYRKALRKLDCCMKTIITDCQKPDYKCVRKEVKDQVKCCHKCLINPFYRCKSCDCGCGCACPCDCGRK